jgi:branched-chain amino acid transport system permease protein
MNHLDQVLIFVIFAVSLNLLLGYAGQVSVAHAAFGAIGGYGMGYLVMDKGWNFVPATLVGVAAAGIVGVLLALMAARLKVEFLILLTLALSSVILGVFQTFPELGGSYGLIGIPKAELFGMTLQNPSDWVIPLVVVAAVIYLICYRIGESPYGRVLKGLREDDQATMALGKNVFRFRVAVFGIASGMAGLAGGLLSAYLQLATPGLFGFAISLSIFAMVIFGGMGNLTGSVLGALVVQGSQPVLERWVDLSPETAGYVRLVVYGLLLAVLMLVRPQGALPEGFSLWRWITRKKNVSYKRIEMGAKVQLEEAGPPEASLGEPAPEVAVSEHGILVDAVAEASGEEAWRSAPVVLEVRGLSKRFGGIVAAADLDMDLHKGTITALVGPNGAGKTTVFNLLTGFIPPDTGSVKLYGKELVGSRPDDIARRGMVRSFQDVRLFMRISCLQNVAMAVQNQPGETLTGLFLKPGKARRAERAGQDEAMKWLEFVGMADFADVPTGALSYGQSKLVALARVLATEADVLLLDEPASGIDTQWVDAMLGLVEELRSQGRTICIVEHNLAVVGRLADHTYFMELGRITAQGTIRELTDSPRLAEAYFGT